MGINVLGDTLNVKNIDALKNPVVDFLFPLSEGTAEHTDSSGKKEEIYLHLHIYSVHLHRNHGNKAPSHRLFVLWISLAWYENIRKYTQTEIPFKDGTTGLIQLNVYVGHLAFLK